MAYLGRVRHAHQKSAPALVRVDMSPAEYWQIAASGFTLQSKVGAQLNRISTGRHGQVRKAMKHQDWQRDSRDDPLSADSDGASLGVQTWLHRRQRTRANPLRRFANVFGVLAVFAFSFYLLAEHNGFGDLLKAKTNGLLNPATPPIVLPFIYKEVSMNRLKAQELGVSIKEMCSTESANEESSQILVYPRGPRQA